MQNSSVLKTFNCYSLRCFSLTGQKEKIILYIESFLGHTRMLIHCCFLSIITKVIIIDCIDDLKFLESDIPFFIFAPLPCGGKILTV